MLKKERKYGETGESLVQKEIETATRNKFKALGKSEQQKYVERQRGC